MDAEVLVSQRVGLDRAGQEPSAEWGSRAFHMQFTHLGRSGLSVSRLCLGTMNFGPQTQESAAHDPNTKTYVEKRLAEGRTRREIRRCLKRYLARYLYRTLNALHDTPRRLDKHRSVDYEEPGKGDHGFRGSHDAATARKSLLFMISFAQHPVLRPTVSLRPGHKLDAHRPFRQRCLLTRLQTIAGFAKSARHNPNRSPYSRPRCHLLPGHIALAEP